MSLKAFHILFITLSTLLAFGFGAWCLDSHGTQSNSAPLGLGVGSIGLGLGLIGYGIWFLRKLKNAVFQDE